MGIEATNNIYTNKKVNTILQINANSIHKTH